MKKIFTTILVCVAVITGQAQQVQQYSQRLLDMLEFNPSVAGAKLNHEIRIHHRSQWVGFDGAPTSDVISYAGSFSRNNGLGAFIRQDKSGINQGLNGTLDYAHHLPFNAFNLSLGVGLGISQFSSDGREFNPHQLGDNALNTSVMKSNPTATVSGGFLAYNSKFYMGASFVRMLETKMRGNSNAYIPTNTSYFFIAGYDVSPNAKFTIFPSTTIYGSNLEPVQVELTVKAEYMSKFLIGASYRVKNAYVGFIGMRLSKRFFLAYSYDYAITDLSQYSMGSHELILFIEFPYAKLKTKRLFEIYEKPRNQIIHHL